jgi:UDP-glucose 4-epimerase
MIKTIIVTGGLGFIGSHTCVELLNYYNVVIIDNLLNSNIIVLDKIKLITTKNNITFYHVDLLDKQKIDDIFKLHNPYSVIHFAGLKSVGESIQKPHYYYYNNIVTTLNLIEVMERYNCFNLIFSSSATVYGTQRSPLKETLSIGQNITNPYGQTKFMIEQILTDLCISNNKWNIISLRYFNPIGAHTSGLIGENPNDIPNNLMPYILKVSTNNNTNYNFGEKFDCLNIFGNDYNTNDGTCERDFIHVVDLANGHLAAINKINILNGYNVFNLGTGIPTSVSSLINIFQTVNNVHIPCKIGKRREGDNDVCFCDPSYTYSKLGWKTSLSVEDMCSDAWKFQLNSLS